MAPFRYRAFFVRHARISAMLITLAVHGLLILMAVSLIALTFDLPAEDRSFVGRHVDRKLPSMRPREIPVRIPDHRAPAKIEFAGSLKVGAPKAAAIPRPTLPSVSGGLDFLKGTDGLSDGRGEGIEFFGVVGTGSYVVFILDFSLSMQGEKEGIMRAEAARILQSLSRDTRFNVICFAGPAWIADTKLEQQLDLWVRTGGDPFLFRPRSWSRLRNVRYLRASHLTVARLVEVVETTPLFMGTVYDNPIYMALSMDPLPDTIFFLTDGECPESRGIDSLRKMVEQLKADGRKVPVLHTVGLGVTHSDQLEAMAGLTGGESRYLTARDYRNRYGLDELKRGRRARFDINQKVESVPLDQYPVDVTLQ